jgi:histidine triad (HIT) family protein
MYNHSKTDYKCPICLAIKGVENDSTMIKQDDIFYKDDLIVGIINSKYVKHNPGHIILVPREHYENIYDLPDEIGAKIFQMSRIFSIALKEIRKCDGITIRQNNEPASNQHAFHYHLHIFPRFEGDDFENLSQNTNILELSERKKYAGDLISWIENKSL